MLSRLEQHLLGGQDEWWVWRLVIYLTLDLTSICHLLATVTTSSMTPSQSELATLHLLTTMYLQRSFESSAIHACTQGSELLASEQRIWWAASDLTYYINIRLPCEVQ
jgi:hypothetical protein